MGETWPPGDVATLPLEMDQAEAVQRAVERVSGMRGEGCPFRALADPYVQRVVNGHRHWGKGELSARYGGDVPEAIWRGVEVFDAALGAVDAFDLREATKPRDNDAPVKGRVTYQPAHSLRKERRRKTP